jgi:hypothetical protein
MFALLQIYPPEALPLTGEPDDDCGGVDVLAIDASIPPIVYSWRCRRSFRSSMHSRYGMK